MKQYAKIQPAPKWLLKLEREYRAALEHEIAHYETTRTSANRNNQNQHDSVGNGNHG